MPPAPPDLTSALQDRYRLQQELGPGGMATVCRAHDLQHDRQVDGGIVYLQGPEQTSTSYRRVVPNWVAQMKAAVDAAN